MFAVQSHKNKAGATFFSDTAMACSIVFISSYKINVDDDVVYKMLLSLMPIEETGERRVRTDCLNFYVSL